MCADEAYCSGRDAGKRRVAPALIPAPHVMPTAALRCAAHMSPTNPLLPPGLSGRPVVVGLAPRETAYLIHRP